MLGEPRLAQMLGLVVFELQHTAGLEVHAALQAEGEQPARGVLKPRRDEPGERGGMGRKTRVERALRIPGRLGRERRVAVDERDAPAPGGETRCG